jgi:hypothetical protein
MKRQFSLANRDENLTWSRENLGMWKLDIINFNDQLNVPRDSIMLRNKLQIDLRAHLIKEQL